VDGRDRMVDIYRYRKANKNIGPGLIYWGKYTAHDNNRDGMVMSQVLTSHDDEHVLRLASHRAA